MIVTLPKKVVMTDMGPITTPDTTETNWQKVDETAETMTIQILN